MKRTLLLGVVLVGLVVAGVIRQIQPASGQSAVAAAPHIGEGGLPQFQVDPNWPKLPAKWKMGFGSAVTADDQDHIWILSRPDARESRSLPQDTLPCAPPGWSSTTTALHPGWGGRGPRLPVAVQREHHVLHKASFWSSATRRPAQQPANLPTATKS